MVDGIGDYQYLPKQNFNANGGQQVCYTDQNGNKVCTFVPNNSVPEDTFTKSTFPEQKEIQPEIKTQEKEVAKNEVPQRNQNDYGVKKVRYDSNLSKAVGQHGQLPEKYRDKNGEVTLVKIGGGGCGPCEQLDQQLSNLQSKYGNKLAKNGIKIIENNSGHYSQACADAGNGQGVPQFVAFDSKTGKCLGNIGARDANSINQSIDKLLSRNSTPPSSEDVDADSYEEDFDEAAPGAAPPDGNGCGCGCSGTTTANNSEATQDNSKKAADNPENKNEGGKENLISKLISLCMGKGFNISSPTETDDGGVEADASDDTLGNLGKIAGSDEESLSAQISQLTAIVENTKAKMKEEAEKRTKNIC